MSETVNEADENPINSHYRMKRRARKKKNRKGKSGKKKKKQAEQKKKKQAKQKKKIQQMPNTSTRQAEIPSDSEAQPSKDEPVFHQPQTTGSSGPFRTPELQPANEDNTTAGREEHLQESELQPTSEDNMAAKQPGAQGQIPLEVTHLSPEASSNRLSESQSQDEPLVINNDEDTAEATLDDKESSSLQMSFRPRLNPCRQFAKHPPGVTKTHERTFSVDQNYRKRPIPCRSFAAHPPNHGMIIQRETAVGLKRQIHRLNPCQFFARRPTIVTPEEPDLGLTCVAKVSWNGVPVNKQPTKKKSDKTNAEANGPVNRIKLLQHFNNIHG